MRIEKNKMVSLIYELREENESGRVLEVMDEKRPLEFVYGTGRLLPLFESNINSLNEGDLFNFTLDPEMAYGDKREEMIVNVPVSVFEADGKLDDKICRVGNEVPMMDSEGNPLTGVINEISDAFVTMDFNHPMAGLRLYFSGKIVNVREATDEELKGDCHSGCSCSDSHDHNGCACS